MRGDFDVLAALGKAFAQCLRIAKDAVKGELADGTGGATYYHVEGLSPPWAKTREPVARVIP